MSLFKKTVWKDSRGRLHDVQGKFTKIPRSEVPLSPDQESLLGSGELYFYQEEDKPNTYTRTGTFIEVETDHEEIWATCSAWILTLSGLIIYIGKYFF
jgi:hypothetical protein